MHDAALHDQNGGGHEFTKRGMAGAVKFIAACFPNPNTDRAAVLSAALELADSDLDSDNGRILRGFLWKNPSHYGAERASAWINAVRRTVPDPQERISVYLKQFPDTVTVRQRQAMARFMMRRMATELRALMNNGATETLGAAADSALVAHFGHANRLNTGVRTAERATRSRNRSGRWDFCWV